MEQQTEENNNPAQVPVTPPTPHVHDMDALFQPNGDRHFILATMITLSTQPFVDDLPDDLKIVIKGKNEQGLIVDVTNNMSCLPYEDSQLSAWLISQAVYSNVDPYDGMVLYARASGINYNRRFEQPTQQPEVLPDNPTQGIAT